jgi:hypothetical protein
MAKLSRRDLIAGVAASAPLPLYSRRAGPAVAQPRPVAPASSSHKLDPIVAKVDSWIAERGAIDAMMEQWADLEVVLCEKTRSRGVSLVQAYRCGFPEAREMRALDRNIKRGLCRLDRAAQRIVFLDSSSAQGALAKIRLGVRIQGPYDWNDDCAYALVHEGCEQLTAILSR